MVYRSCIEIEMDLNVYDKYKVNSFDDFKSNYRQIQLIKSFLYTNEHNLCLISGSLATGKSTILNIVKNIEDFECLSIDSESNYSTEFTDFVNKRSIESIIFNKKRLILIDDIHLMEKTFINNLKTCKDKVIATVQFKEEVKITELKNSLKTNSLYIKLNKITFQDCFIVVNDLLENLNLNDKISCETTMDVIKENKCNIRQTLQYLSKKTKTDERVKITHNLNDMNIYELTNYYINHKIDKKFISLNVSNIVFFILYENISKLLPFKNKSMLNNTMNEYKLILQNITLMNSDTLQHESIDSKYIFDNYTVPLVNIILVKEKKDDISLKFTNIFNKLSVQSSFNKKINTNTTRYGFVKPYMKAMCMKDNDDFIYKKLCADFK